MYRGVLLSVCVLMAGLSGLMSGCFLPKEAIAVSNSELDFQLSENPMYIDVWNKDTSVDTMVAAVSANRDWIQTDVSTITSAAPDAAGNLDKQTVRVSILRNQLSDGEHTGRLRFTGSNLVTVEVQVKVRQEGGGGPTGELNIVNATHTYSEPYLIDFSFSLEDGEGSAVVAEPAQFSVTALEGDTPISSETGLHVRKSAARQLKVDLVLDYSLSMQQIDGAIEAMEDAAINELLPALNEDALVGIVEFHREDWAPERVADFTVDRTFLRNQINAIQSDYVDNFPTGSRTWDAVVESADAFGEEDPMEERYIILFSDGYDTSSLADRNDAVAAAEESGVVIYAIGFGDPVDKNALKDITRRTGGVYFSAESVDDLDEAFIDIVDNLGAQYTLRWASLRRDSSRFTPSFTIELDGESATHVATDTFRPTNYAEDRSQVLEGQLRLVPSTSENNTTVFLRTDYVPRNIDAMSLFVKSSAPYVVTIVGAGDDGLLAGWDISLTEDEVLGGTWIDLDSDGEYLPFATFGPLLRFNFGQVVDETTPLFEQIYVDDTIYPNGQYFVVEGFVNTPPES